MTEKEIEAMKHNIETQLDEYEAEIKAASLWYRQWKLRRGFRCVEQAKTISGEET